MVHEARFRVRYAETDQMGVVYYANYLVWMEIGRAEYCRAAGIRYKDMEADDGVRLAVVHAQCRYLHPARYDQEIAVETRVARANRRMVEFQYRIRDAETHQELAVGRNAAHLPRRGHEAGEAARKILPRISGSILLVVELDGRFAFELVVIAKLDHVALAFV